MNRENVLVVVTDFLDQEIAKALMTRQQLEEGGDEVSVHIREVQDKNLNRLKEIKQYLEANLK